MREDGDVREPAPRPVQAADRLGHGARLRPRVRRHHDSDWSAAAAPRGDEVGLGREVAVAADEVGGAVENLLERAPVVSERQPPPAEPGPDVLDLRVSPAVDRLLGVTDSRDVAELIPRQQADQVQLDAVGVLELVHEEVSKSLAAAGAKLGYALQRIDDR